MLPERKRLFHEVPSWVADGSTYFITVCCVPRSKNQLAHPEISDAVFETVRYHVKIGTWWMSLMLLMPDHLHMLVSFSPCEKMATVIGRWKSLLARRHGIEWQDGFFDHRIRNERALQEKQAYILNNPVRAGLVAVSEEWSFTFGGTEP